jgi:hypothetical protein
LTPTISCGFPSGFISSGTTAQEACSSPANIFVVSNAAGGSFFSITSTFFTDCTFTTPVIFDTPIYLGWNGNVASYEFQNLGDVEVCVSPTPTPTITPSVSVTPTITPSITPSVTPTLTPSSTPVPQDYLLYESGDIIETEQGDLLEPNL